FTLHSSSLHKLGFPFFIVLFMVSIPGKLLSENAKTDKESHGRLFENAKMDKENQKDYPRMQR
ncbi:hypothetical protein, partial [Tetragenococcus halophilus]